MYSSAIIERLPNKPLTNHELLACAKLLRLPHFRGVFMRDVLPEQIAVNESGIVNLDSYKNNGTHWVCYYKEGHTVDYFDSFGNLRPPIELQRYFNSSVYQVIIKYNYFPSQQETSVNCGHLCLDFLNRKTKK